VTDKCSRLLRAPATVVVALAAVSPASAGNVGFGGAGVLITADGVSPRSLQMKARHVLPFWVNEDVVAHTVTFDDGRCVVTVPPGGRAWCEGAPHGFFAGTFSYRISDVVQPAAEIVVVPNERRVTMEASRTTVRAGQAVVLQGTVFAAAIAPFAGMNMPQTITVLRRIAGSRGFVVVWRVRSQYHPSPCYCDPNENVWSTTIRPRVTATYVARVVDPPDQTIWKRAEGRRIVVRVAQ